ncbi:MAG: EscU/YscU/HrcU family type III secretion system export apparatus switch protein [Candidatus Omnitrophica bacterium]|nr:EscU/YscU/HrcU family type III secretion system export apparatus switch protein [Candidatus Omnitrophota bacterium]
MKKKAVALKYRQKKDKAPRLTAKGQNSVAERIITLAKETRVPVYEDPGLTNALYPLQLGEYIPEEFYEVAATILAWVYSLDKKEAR